MPLATGTEPPGTPIEPVRTKLNFDESSSFSRIDSGAGNVLRMRMRGDDERGNVSPHRAALNFSDVED